MFSSLIFLNKLLNILIDNIIYECKIGNRNPSLGLENTWEIQFK